MQPSSGPLSGAALLLDTCSLLQPGSSSERDRPRSWRCWSRKRVGREELGAETCPITSPHTTLPVDTPPLVAVKVQSRLSGARKRPGGCEARRRRCARGRQRPVDTSPTVVKFPVLAVLLIVSVLPRASKSAYLTLRIVYDKKIKQ